MKKVINIGIGGRSFAIDEDAYTKLKKYLSSFRTKSKIGLQSKEVMDDLEERIAELFSENLTSYKNVVDLNLVNSIIAQLGMPDGEPFEEDSNNFGFEHINDIINDYKPNKKFYRNPINKSIGGVCSGLATYFNIDLLLIRILFVVIFFMGSTGFWVYIILWIAVPLAVTPAQKCELYGLPATAENLRKFSTIKN